MIQEKKAEWELRRKTDQRRKNVEKISQIGVEECKEYSYERETDGIGSVDKDK